MIKKSQILNKQKKISYGKGFPGNREGEDGDITIRIVSGQGLFLFVKINTKWYQTRLSLFRPKGSENNEPVVLPISRSPKRTGELTLDPSTKLRVGTGNTSNKQVVGIDSNRTLDTEEIILTRSKDSGSASTEDLLIRNSGSGRALIHVQTTNASADPYLLLSYRGGGETPDLNQWVVGIDNSDSDKLKFCRAVSASPLTPSTTDANHRKMILDTAGNLEILGTLDIGDVATIGSDTDKFLMLDGTTVKRVTGANLRSYIGAGTGDGDITSVVAGDGLTGGATSGDATLNVNVDDSTIETNSDALRIKDDGVTYAKLQNVTNARMLGNNAGSDGVVTEMTKANVLTFLNVADGATANAGDVTLAGTQTITGVKTFNANVHIDGSNSRFLYLDGAGESAYIYASSGSNLGIGVDG
ncbi:MAG: hypothetical protein Unbinned3338contig1000_1, partial [Prokaryotic dsDNA virus sp.]